LALKQTVSKLFYLDELIRSESTGSIKELSKKLNVSQRQVYNYLKIFNEVGRANRYDATKSSYVYTDKVKKQIDNGRQR